MEKIKNIINNEKVGNVFCNLFGRWLDEKGYEDINEYGKAICNCINRQYPDYNVELVKSTSEPFGVVINIDNKKVHCYAVEKGSYIQLNAKIVK